MLMDRAGLGVTLQILLHTVCPVWLESRLDTLLVWLEERRLIKMDSEQK